jgi:putative redox protein
MLEVQVTHLGDVQFEVKARQHTLYCDQPASNGGFDEGMTPPELLLASVGACAGHYAVEYLKAHNLLAEGLRIRATAEKAKNPARLSEIGIEVTYPFDLAAKDREGVLNAVHKCLIHNTLVNPPKIRVELHRAELPAAA